MDARLQRRVQRYGWDKAAGFYETYWAAQLAPAQDALLDLAALAPGERVVDVACGSGLVTFRAATAVGSSGSVVAVDLSAEMVTLVRDGATRRALANVTAERMDAEVLELPDQAFDVALCALGLMYVPDPRAAMREMHRVLKPGGRVVIAVWGARKQCGWAEIFPIVDKRVASEVCPLFFQLGGGGALQAGLEATGFSLVSVQRLATSLHYASADEACGAAFAGGPVALAYTRFDDAVRNEVHAEYLASIAAFKHGDGYDIPGEFVVARGVRAG